MIDETKRRVPEELIDSVVDRESFIAFVEALALEREVVEEMERAEPLKSSMGGAMAWQHSSISAFLGACLACFDAGTAELPETLDGQPTWRLLAEFLYFGKIYE